jgi:hypothetical protein
MSDDLKKRPERELKELLVPGAILEWRESADRFLMRVERVEADFIHYETFSGGSRHPGLRYAIRDLPRYPCAPRSETDWLCAILEGRYER